MSGLATALHEALWELMEKTDTHSSTLPEEARGITTEQLDLMDAAAEVTVRLPEREWAASGMTTLMFALEGGGVGHVSFRTEAERDLLGALLARHVRRRKEGGA